MTIKILIAFIFIATIVFVKEDKDVLECSDSYDFYDDSNHSKYL